jgi:nicotinamide-nucleotide amidase
MIAARFASFRVQMTENNRRQAYLPEAALVIENPVGTAPGFIVEYEGRVVISLPGVPREMKFLMAERVIPYLREKFSLGSNIIKARVLRTAGIGESLLDAKIGSDLLEMGNPTVGLAAHTGQVDVRITAKAPSETEADIMIGEVESRLRERIGDFIFGVDSDRIQDVLVRTLRENALHVAISETGIGPSISQMFASAEQGSQVIRTIQSFAHIDDLRRQLNAPPEMEIRELAEQIASTVCQQAKADAAIAVVSRLDSETDRADQDGGTAIAVYMPGLPARSRVYGFGGLNDVAQSWASTWSLSTLWRMVKEMNHGA